MLYIEEKEWPDQWLREIWVALAVADDGNGYLSAGKFGVWIRSGAEPPERLSMLERRRMMGIRSRRILDEKTKWLVDYESGVAARKVRQCDQETAAIKREIMHLKSICSPGSSAAGTPQRPQSARTDLRPKKPDAPWTERPNSARQYGRAKGQCAALFS